MTVTGKAPVEGICDSRFNAIRKAFENNFARHGEPGAAIAVSVNGHLVADLWGGWSDIAGTKPWTRETLVNVFSVGKALTALCILQLCERGVLALDLPVSHAWPDFAKGGKEAVTLRQTLSHRSGLPALRDPLPDGAMLDWTQMTQALAAERPWWKPGDGHGYHVNTFGYLLGELARRATGNSIGALLRSHVAGPLGADVYIGLPESEHDRVAEFHWPVGQPKPPDDISDDMVRMRWNAYWNPPGLSGAGWANTREWRLAEIPSTNGHATARGVARVYAALANGGSIDHVRVISPEVLHEAAAEQAYGTDLVLERTTRFGLGFQLTHPERMLGPNPNAFGHFGAGGSLGFCDPDTGVAFGYVTCDMGPRWQNPRNQALIDAVYGSL